MSTYMLSFTAEQQSVIDEAAEYAQKRPVKKFAPLTIEQILIEGAYRAACKIVSDKEKYLRNKSNKEGEGENSRRCCQCAELIGKKSFTEKMQKPPCDSCHGDKSHPNFRRKTSDYVKIHGVTNTHLNKRFDSLNLM